MGILDRLRGRADVEKREVNVGQEFAEFLTSKYANFAVGPSAIETIAANWLSRSLAMANVTGRGRKYFTQQVLMTIGDNLMRKGESVWLRLDGRLLYVSDYEYKEGRYEIDRRSYADNQVLHIRYLTDWGSGAGIAPLDSATNLKATLRNIEKELRNESNIPSGYLMPIPDTVNADTFRTALRGIGGKFLPVPSKTVFKEGTASDEYQKRRTGAEIPPTALQLYKQVSDYALAIYGVPQSAVYGADAASMREGIRVYLHAVILPVGRLIIDAASRATLSIDLNFDELMAADIQGRARAAQSLVQGVDVDAEYALKVAGLPSEEEVADDGSAI